MPVPAKPRMSTEDSGDTVATEFGQISHDGFLRVSRQARHEVEHLPARTQKLGVAILLHLKEPDRMHVTIVEHGGGQSAPPKTAPVSMLVRCSRSSGISETPITGRTGVWP